MSKQVLRSKKVQHLRTSYFNEISIDKSYITNITEENFVINNGYNSINIVPTNLNANYTEPNIIRIGSNLDFNILNNIGRSIYIGNNFSQTGQNLYQNYVIGNNNNKTNNTEFLQCIGNNNQNISFFRFVFGNNNNFNATSDEGIRSVGFVVGNSNYIMSEYFSITFIGVFGNNNNILGKANNFVIGNDNTVSNLNSVFLDNIIIGQNNIAPGGAKNTIIGNTNIISHFRDTTCLGSYNNAKTTATQNLGSYGNGLTIIGNYNGGRQISPVSRQYGTTIIGNYNLYNDYIASRQTILGSRNNTDKDGFICVGNYNIGAENSIIIGSGITNNVSSQVILNTFSANYREQVSTTSKLLINCPFGSNISSDPADRNKLFYDETNNKIFYNIL